MYVLKHRTKAFVIKEDGREETEIILNGASLKRNTIDYRYAFELGLKTVAPEIVTYTSGQISVQEKVSITLDVPVTNIESRLVTFEADLIRQSTSKRETIIISRRVIKNLLAYVDYNE